ncbi:Hypothetical protein NTJ_03159 [Nesidiocoris tenuis]|uniref:Uncharacterized protein n=1 Tax=Nesidiocoris tenuis TaxID=355587 RepID=A0ABN7AG59_9HEMI|nr:Hypothetical protein NTJ_03159 [Nesidiocoris tenuis]
MNRHRGPNGRESLRARTTNAAILSARDRADADATAAVAAAAGSVRFADARLSRSRRLGGTPLSAWRESGSCAPMLFRPRAARQPVAADSVVSAGDAVVMRRRCSIGRIPSTAARSD